MFKQIISGGAAALSLSLLTALSIPQTAHAAICTFSDGGAALQTVFDDLTTIPAGNSTTDVTTDCLTDKWWSIAGSGLSAATLIDDASPYSATNKFGIYDATDSSNTVEIFDGAAASDFNFVSVFGDGSVWILGVDSGIDFSSNKFGYYLTSLDGTFYSDSSLNPGGLEYMYAYHGNGDQIQILPFSPGIFGPGEYILAFEDHLIGGADPNDKTGMVLLVESSHPHDPPGSSSGGGGELVPEPTMLILVALGLVGIGLFRRRPNSDRWSGTPLPIDRT